MTDREKAKREYLGGKSLAEIAKMLGKKDSTIRSWKKRDRWPNVQRKKASKNKSVAASQLDKEKKQAIIEPLNEKQQLFCEFYVRNWNATQAYMTVYGVDRNTANSSGSRLLANDSVRAYIKSLKEIKCQALMADQTDVVEMYMKIAFANIGDFVEFGRRDVHVMGPFGPIVIKDEETGKKSELMKTINYVDVKKSTEVDSGVIQEISQGKDGIKIKLADRMKALEWLSKYFAMMPMDQHRMEYENAKRVLDKLEYERKKKHDESENW